MDRQVEAILTQLDEHVQSAVALSDLAPAISDAASMISAAFKAGNQLFVCGNGGSAADAQHIAAEFSGRFLIDRDPLPALALTTNTSALTAIGNDYGFDEVFARQLRAHARKGDVLLGISTSGNSENVWRACSIARDLGVSVIAMLGGDGGKIAPLCDIELTPPTKSTPRIQEAHIFMAHVICGLVEESVCVKR